VLKFKRKFWRLKVKCRLGQSVILFPECPNVPGYSYGASVVADQGSRFKETAGLVEK
jgi:hypothetical protein